MTNEDAIYWIKNLAVLSTEKDMPQIEEALNMAIEALQDRKTEYRDCINCECPDDCTECREAEHGCKTEPQTTYRFVEWENGERTCDKNSYGERKDNETNR